MEGELVSGEGPPARSDASGAQDRVFDALHLLLVVLVPWTVCPPARQYGLAKHGCFCARDLPTIVSLRLLRLGVNEPVCSILEVALVISEGTSAVSC